MHEEFEEKGAYFKKYIELLAMRSTFANLSLEFESDDLSSPEKAVEVLNCKDAVEYIFEYQSPESKVYPTTIEKINTIINRGKDLAPGYRKVAVLTGLGFEAPPAREIASRIMSLLDNYYNIWDMLDIYEREARFNIEFIRIQPFEDGNKRTANVIVNYHLFKDQKASIIIDSKHKEEYLSYIENYEVNKMAKLFKELSESESKIMEDIYNAMGPIEKFELKHDGNDIDELTNHFNI